MNPPARLTLSARKKSLVCALNGIAIVLTSQPNAWIHAAATMAVTAAGVYIGLSRTEWCWIVLALAAVWAAEIFNTALEFHTDLASPSYHPLAGKAKDVAAGAVLTAAASAAVIGAIIFLPHIAVRL